MSLKLLKVEGLLNVVTVETVVCRWTTWSGNCHSNQCASLAKHGCQLVRKPCTSMI